MTVLVEKNAVTLEDGIKTLIESAITDYKKRYGDGLNTDIGKKMVGNFINGFVVKSGQKYVKIMSGNGGTVGGSCWGFIVKEDTPKFKKGDILKPAGWNKPATNAPRGNVLDGMYEINWTGPMYLS
tara:strand:- start:151 stop:528 length:378 start_codon:yes stop_codon:yes gene_type:complete